MARVASIKIEKNSKGEPTSITYNLKKFPQAINIASKMGAIDDEFEREWKRGIAGDELRENLHKRIDNWSER